MNLFIFRDQSVKNYKIILHFEVKNTLKLSICSPEVAKTPPTMPHSRTKKPQNDRCRLSTRTIMDDMSYLKKIPKIKRDMIITVTHYLRNRPQVSMVYRLINHTECW